MNLIKRALTVAFPQYLSSLPIPDTLEGFVQLKPSEWLQLGPLIGTIFVILLTYLYMLLGRGSGTKLNSRCNTKVKLGTPKVVDIFGITEIEDLCVKQKGKCTLCRCWKSNKFPYCDGSHVAHNKETGDNVGPLVIEKK